MTLPGRYAQIAFEVFDLRVEVRAELVVTDLPAIYRESHDRAKDTNKTPQDSGLHPRPTSIRKEYGEDTRSGYERDQTEQLQTNVISESDIRTHLSVAALNGEKLCRLITLFGKRHVEIMRPTSQMCQSRPAELAHLSMRHGRTFAIRSCGAADSVSRNCRLSINTERQ
jgi:hypothetical protein